MPRCVECDAELDETGSCPFLAAMWHQAADDDALLLLDEFEDIT
jgi:hypothetical protein